MQETERDREKDGDCLQVKGQKGRNRCGGGKGGKKGRMEGRKDG